MRTLLLAICLPWATACGPPAPSSITKIVLSVSDCSQGCQFAQYTFFSDGRFKFSDGSAADDVQGPLRGQIFATLANDVVRLPAYGSRWDYAAGSALPLTYIWIEAGGRHWQVRFPTYDLFGGGIPTQDKDVYDLTRFTEYAKMEGEAALAEVRTPIIARLRDLTHLASVEFDSRGCYGTCPIYRATFYRDGTARLDNVRFFKSLAVSSGRAYVPFATVLDALRNAGITGFRHAYPIHWVDSYGIAFHLRFNDGFVYDITAPDSESWPPNVARLVGEFSQIVIDTHWEKT